MDDVMEDEDDGGRRWIVSGNPAMRIDSIYIKLIECMLFLLDLNYNLGLIYI